MTKKTRVGFIGFVSLTLAIAAAAAYFGYQILRMPVSSNKTEIIFEVNPGTSLSQISGQLREKNLIRNARLFQLYATVKGLASKFKVGEYSLNQGMKPDEIIRVIVSGKSIARTITVTEGLNLYDIAAIFEKNKIATSEEFFKIVVDRKFIQSLLNENVTSLEGYLYPETYKFTKFEDAKSIVTQMVNRFLGVWKEIEPQANAIGWSRAQVVTFASIIEKETGAGFERPIVSSVFHNRINKKMRLQTDPTVLYGLAVLQGKMPTNITKNDLLTPTVYNTYTIMGLPPTPIANPGIEALQAAVKPAKSNYLFFVSQNNGTHIFSENIQQHNKAVKEYQQNARQRANKSWRDLKKAKK